MTNKGASGGGRGCAISCLAVLAAVLVGIYWISPLHDPRNSGPARAEAGRRAQQLQSTLWTVSISPDGGFSRGDVGTFEDEASRLGGTVIDVRSHTTRERRDFDVVVAMTASSAPKFGVVGPMTQVRVCYRYSWQGYAYTMKHRAVQCPKDLSPLPIGDRSTPHKAASRPDDALSMSRLASRIDQQKAGGAGGLPPDAAAIAEVLRSADVSPVIPRTTEVRSGVGLFALGTSHSCVLGSLDHDGVRSWMAPWETPCTTESAFQGYAIRQWPPLVVDAR